MHEGVGCTHQLLRGGLVNALMAGLLGVIIVVKIETGPEKIRIEEHFSQYEQQKICIKSKPTFLYNQTFSWSNIAMQSNSASLF